MKLPCPVGGGAVLYAIIRMRSTMCSVHIAQGFLL